jgi:hydrogenase nickel incorporation protein HypA/HybF
VHELSIAHGIVETIVSAAEPVEKKDICEVRLRVGALSAVMKDSLLFCYDIATQDTPLAGSKLVVNEVPVVIYCSKCAAERKLPGVQSFRCPVCNTPSGEIRQGRELEIESLLINEYSST